MQQASLSDPSRTAAPASPAPPRVYFDAELRPHRSLGPLGFALVMGSVAIGGFAVGVAFFLAGAWPVLGFCGLEILLLYIAFRLNYRSGRVRQTLRLSDEGLDIAFTDPAGRVSRVTLEPAWLKVDLPDPPTHDSQLRLSSHGRSITVGAFLTPAERGEVARALRDALARYRAPEHLKPAT